MHGIECTHNSVKCMVYTECALNENVHVDTKIEVENKQQPIIQDYHKHVMKVE